MFQKIRIFLEKQHMIESGDHVIAGLSGGADSVFLLLLLDELRKTMGFSLTAVHVEHGIRGEESLRDAQFSRRLSESRGIPFVMYSADAPSRAKQRHLTLEEAARELRYECFRRALDECGADKVAVAHHADDLAETMLFHLARGTGIRGLSGIAPVLPFAASKPCAIIRPLLCVTRREIEEWLKKQGQSYCEDSTNSDLYYARNRIRTQILPEMRLLNARAAEHMQRTAAELAEISAFLDETALQRGRDCYEKRDCPGHPEAQEIRIDCEKFLALPAVLQKNLMHQLIAMAAGRKKDIGAVHVELAIGLAAGGTGKRVMLPCGLIAEKSYGEVFLRKKEETNAGIPPADLKIPGVIFPVNGITVRTELIEFDGNLQQIPKKRYTKWFDYDKIKFTVQLRNRSKGDFLTINSDGGTKKLKNWFIDEKIPQNKRDAIPLLADGNHILWVCGYRISEAYKVSKETKRVLVVALDGKIHSEDEVNE